MDKTFYAIGIVLVLLGLIALYSSSIRVEYSSRVIDVPVYTITTIPPGTYIITKTGDLLKVMENPVELEANKTFTQTINITTLKSETWSQATTSQECLLNPVLNLYIEGETSENKKIAIQITQGKGDKQYTLVNETIEPLKEGFITRKYNLRLYDPDNYPLIEITLKPLAKTKLYIIKATIPYTCTRTITLSQPTLNATSTTSQYYIPYVSSIRYDNIYIALTLAIIGLALMIEGVRRNR